MKWSRLGTMRRMLIPLVLAFQVLEVSIASAAPASAHMSIFHEKGILEPTGIGSSWLAFGDLEEPVEADAQCRPPYPPHTPTWSGSKTHAKRLAEIGVRNGLRITSEKRDKDQTASGKRSDHSRCAVHSYAYDLAGNRRAMANTAHQIAHRLGVPDYYGGRILNVTKDGFRYQLIWNCGGSACGGNHFDHVHIGVRNTKPNG